MPGNNHSEKKQRHQAFTLIEILVVVGIFAALSVVIVNVYLMALGAQRQTGLRQKTLSNVRYTLESIARQIRTSEIDYGYYITNDMYPLDYSVNKLALIDQSGKSYLIYQSNGRELKMQIDEQDYYLVSPDEIDVSNLKFFIEPSTSPFREERCNDAKANRGCLVTAGACTVDNASLGYSGYCSCASDDQCQTDYCDPVDRKCLPPNKQPRVTIVLGFISKGLRDEEKKEVSLQTTVSSRIYKR